MPRPPAIVATFFAANLTGLAGALLYAALVDDSEQQFLVRYVLWVSVACVPVNAGFLLWFIRPFTAVRRALDAGETPRTIDPRLQQQVLQSPRPVYAVLIAQWVLPALTIPLCTELTGPGFGPATVHAMVAGTAVGVFVAAAGFYGFSLLVAARVAPLLLASGSLAHLGEFRPGRVWRDVALLLLNLGILAPLSTAILVGSELATPPVIALLTGLYLLGATAQGAATLQVTSVPLGHLASRLARVGGGDYSVRARVTALDTLGEVSAAFNDMVAGLAQREELRETFGRYVSPAVAEEVLARRVALGGERREATVLFSDIRGFTSMSETMAPEAVVAFLNRYLTEMVACVDAEGGTLDKFVGDAVMAVFGVPLGAGSPAEDAAAAYRCARAMCSALDELNAERAAAGEVPMEIGIGLHSGELLAGNIGSPHRMQYTVIGDTVNTASRLEGLTKQLKVRLAVSGEVAALLGGSADLERIDAMPVRGREAPIEVWVPAEQAARRQLPLEKASTPNAAKA